MKPFFPALIGLPFLFAPAGLSEAKPATSIANGEDLLAKPLEELWKPFSEKPETKMGEVWQLKDGVLSCKGTPKGGIYLDRDLADFTLTLEWRWPSEEGKGGVLIRTTKPFKIWPKSLEAQINAGNAGDFWGSVGLLSMARKHGLKRWITSSLGS